MKQLKLYTILIGALGTFFMGFTTLSVTIPVQKKLTENDIICTNFNNCTINSAIHQSPKKQVIKHVLSNGLTILVRSVNTQQDVAVHLLYGVGSKHEITGTQGYAHALEHMLFKGTTKMSEIDIRLVTQKCGGDYNAFTAYDTTCMVFSFPLSCWKVALPILADCMTNCTLKQELLDSEMQVVVQEFKMGRDNFDRALYEALCSSLFYDHPYHYPIIGYKRDLLNLSSDALKKFYKQYYVPNNAVLLVVGNVDPDDVIREAEKEFGAIPASPDFVKAPAVPVSYDIRSQDITLYRDVAKPEVNMAYLIPGLSAKQDYYWGLLSNILTRPKTGILTRLLLDELKLVTEIQAFPHCLHDGGIFFISFTPQESTKTDYIITLIEQELKKISTQEIDTIIINDQIQSFQTSFYTALEKTHALATTIGEYYMATGDEEYLFSFIDSDIQNVQKTIKQLTATYLRPSVRHVGKLLPLPEEEQKYWKLQQEESDRDDARILAGKQRNVTLEQGQYVHTISCNEQALYQFPTAQKKVLDNGLSVLWYTTNMIPLVTVTLSLKADNYYEPDEFPGILNLVYKLLFNEGSKKYPGETLAEAFEHLGAQCSVSTSKIILQVLAQHLPQVLELLHEMITNPLFDGKLLDITKQQYLQGYHEFWKNPSNIINYHTNKLVYKDHPYSQLHITTPEVLEKITINDIKQVYTTLASPDKAILTIVGALDEYPQLPELVSKLFNTWHGEAIPEIIYPKITQTDKPELIKHELMRDQVYISLSNLSVNRFDPAYKALSLFEDHLHKELFNIREQTGLFYMIYGHLVVGANKEPGKLVAGALVSRDNTRSALTKIHTVLNKIIDSYTEDDLQAAKRAHHNNCIQQYQTSISLNNVFTFLERYDLPADYYTKEIEAVNAITLSDVKKAVREFLDSKRMHTVLVGRVNDLDVSNLPTTKLT